MLNIFSSSKFGVVLRTTADANVLYPAVWKAATAEPSRTDRRRKHREAPAIGATWVADLDPAAAVQEHQLSRRPEGAVEIHFGAVVVRALVMSAGPMSEARFVCITDPKSGFARAAALADRTGVFLTQAGITTFETSVLKSPGYFPSRHVHSHVQ
jgi:hypothetical protein